MENGRRNNLKRGYTRSMYYCIQLQYTPGFQIISMCLHKFLFPLFLILITSYSTTAGETWSPDSIISACNNIVARSKPFLVCNLHQTISWETISWDLRSFMNGLRQVYDCKCPLRIYLVFVPETTRTTEETAESLRLAWRFAPCCHTIVILRNQGGNKTWIR